MKRVFLKILVCTLAGCAGLPLSSSPRTSMRLHFDNEQMRAEVMKYLSIGMPVENAKRIMQDSGFKCEDAFGTESPCLNCYAVYKSHFLKLICDEINVGLYHESGLLKEIKVACQSVGP